MTVVRPKGMGIWQIIPGFSGGTGQILTPSL
jgi:hypothetical protein